MKRAGKIWLGFLVITLIILLSQCSPYAGKNLLTFFFDGVPVADSTGAESPVPGILPEDSSSIDSGAPSAGTAALVVHYPYGEKECAACHDQQSLGTMVETQPGLCYTCHEDLTTRYNYLHGPVAGGYCTSCHDPHEAEGGKLLRFTGDKLCFHCHREESVYRNEMHEGLEGMGCTDCHNPHGGEDKYIFQ